ncbi:MAG: hypothetical protein ACJ78M_06550 [Gemmatimonadaceae bacterium]
MIRAGAIYKGNGHAGTCPSEFERNSLYLVAMSPDSDTRCPRGETD